MGVPTGWKDDGTTLTAPNGMKVVLGFRAYVLAHAWDAANVPLENEVHLPQLEDSNPALGAGTRQLFVGQNGPAVLEYTPDRGVFVGYAGQELFKVKMELAALQHAPPAGTPDPRIAEAVSDLTALLAKLQAS